MQKQISLQVLNIQQVRKLALDNWRFLAATLWTNIWKKEQKILISNKKNGQRSSFAWAVNEFHVGRHFQGISTNTIEVIPS